MKIKQFIISFARFTWSIGYYLQHDIFSGRLRGVVLIGIANLLPDLLAFSLVRSILWRLAGAKLSDYSTTVIRKGVFTEYPHNLVAGKKFHVNRNTYLDTNGKITIGEQVTISLNCQLLTISHSGIHHEIDKVEPIIIKSYCLIYANCTILPGSVLEEGVILAAGSVLKGGTKPWSVYAGVPARLVKARSIAP